MPDSSPVPVGSTASALGRGLALFLLGAVGVGVGVRYSTDPGVWAPIMLTLVAGITCVAGAAGLASVASRVTSQVDDLHRVYIRERVAPADRTPMHDGGPLGYSEDALRLPPR